MLTPENLTNLIADRPLLVRVLAGLWVAVTAVHITIWLLIAVIGGHLDQPWWLAVSVPLGIVVVVAWRLASPREPGDRDLDDELL